MFGDYGMIVRITPVPWSRETRSDREETYLHELGLFELDIFHTSEAIFDKINELNKDADAQHAAYERERLETQDWDQCPAHGPSYELDGDCTCGNDEPADNWAGRNGLTYYVHRDLDDDEAIYWLEQGADLIEFKAWSHEAK